MQESKSAHIAKNTLFLYFRQILIMLVSLYTVRVVLGVLGAEDYGIYNVVAGVVTMFSFLSGAMAAASQRYFSFDLGKGDTEHLKTTFSVTFQIYVVIAFVIVILAETIGLWFMNNHLVIPLERKTAATWVFQMAMVSFLLTLLTTPYMASIIAHENMNVYAYASIVEVLLKLGIVFLLQILPFDKLSLYGILLAVVSCVNTAVYRFYCVRHYEECCIRFVKDRAMFRELLGYSGWNLFGSLVSVFKNQAINILLNQFFNPVVNASRSIALQVNSAVASFSRNFSTVLHPQIIKSYVSNEYEKTLSFVFRGCRFTFYLMYIFSLPLVIEMDTILHLWLKNPPVNSIIFTRLALIDALIDSISLPISTLVQAHGKIKLYQSLVGGILLFNLPVSYLALEYGAPAYSVMVIAVIITAIAVLARVFIVRKLTSLPIRSFMINVLFSCFITAVFAAVIPIMIYLYFAPCFLRTCLTILTSVISVGLCVLFVGMNKAERMQICKYFRSRIRRSE